MVGDTCYELVASGYRMAFPLDAQVEKTLEAVDGGLVVMWQGMLVW